MNQIRSRHDQLVQITDWDTPGAITIELEPEATAYSAKDGIYKDIVKKQDIIRERLRKVTREDLKRTHYALGRISTRDIDAYDLEISKFLNVPISANSWVWKMHPPAKPIVESSSEVNEAVVEERSGESTPDLPIVNNSSGSNAATAVNPAENTNKGKRAAKEELKSESAKKVKTLASVKESD